MGRCLLLRPFLSPLDQVPVLQAGQVQIQRRFVWAADLRDATTDAGFDRRYAQGPCRSGVVHRVQCFCSVYV